MQVLRLSTQLHKWIALIVGIQVLFWVLGGRVMTVIPIERVRSEHHVAELAATPLPMEGVLGLREVSSAAGVVPVEAALKGTLRGPVWVLKPAKGDPVTVSALTGKPLAPRSSRAGPTSGASMTSSGACTSWISKRARTSITRSSSPRRS